MVGRRYCSENTNTAGNMSDIVTMMCAWPAGSHRSNSMDRNKWPEMAEQERQAVVTIHEERLEEVGEMLENGVFEFVGSGRCEEYL